MTYVAMTGDMEAARRIPDAGERDAAIVTYLLQLDHSVLLGETPDRLPPAGFCDQALLAANAGTHAACQELTEDIRSTHARSSQ
ncbi:MAG: hypothetical protein O3B95_02350 [Chloroflexi bacterium]|nr:hypothetical protein [Chloroflexota bacterium]